MGLTIESPELFLFILNLSNAAKVQSINYCLVKQIVILRIIIFVSSFFTSQQNKFLGSCCCCQLLYT